MKRTSIILISAAIVAFISWFWLFVGTELGEEQIPFFVTKKTDELVNDPVLMDSIGGYRTHELQFNKRHFDAGDTVNYSILIIGNNKRVLFQATQLRSKVGEWYALSDSLIIQER